MTNSKLENSSKKPKKPLKMPQEGGSFIRNTGGSLKRVAGTKPAERVPAVTQDISKTEGDE